MEEYLPGHCFLTDFPGYEKRNHKSADCDRTVEYSKVAGRGGKSGRDPEGKTEVQRKSGDIFLQKKIRSMSRQRKETGWTGTYI